MKRCVHMLLIAGILIPMAGFAREETMEERKKRIMRKYLREHTTTVHSDVMVPVDSDPTDDEVLDSKRFTQADVGIQREEGVKPPPPMPRRPLPTADDRNWLLAEDPAATDPSLTPAEKSPFSQWEYQSDERSRQGTAPQRSVSGQQEQGTSLYGRRFGGATGTFSPNAPQPEDNPFGRRYTSMLDAQQNSPSATRSTPEYTNPLDRFPLNRSGSGTDRQTDPNTARSFGSEGQTFGSDNRQGTSASQAQGYTPLRIPYQSPLNTVSPNQNQSQSPEFQRTTPYQEWKQKTQNWDPMKEGAFK